MKNEVVNDPERFMSYEYDDYGKPIQESERFRYLLDLINNKIKKDGITILDIGGASGVFLDTLMRASNYKISAYNLDFDGYYKDKQVSNEIKFLNLSILDSKMKEEQFDIVTFRHVLHHLVGNNVKETKDNQRKALSEIFRILKEGGTLIFEEQVNNIKLFSRIVYHLSKLANKWGIKSKTVQIGDVIVLFLTQGELRRLIESNDKDRKSNIEIKEMKYVSRNLELKWKITLLMCSGGSVFGVVRKVQRRHNL